MLTVMEDIMDTTSLVRISTALACALCAAALPAASQDGDHNGERARWYRGDSTQQQRLNILRREIDAADAQQQAESRRKSERSRANCLKQASLIHRRDMANAPALVAEAPVSEV